MSVPSTVLDRHWQRCTPTYVETLPVLDFPFETPPDIYAPANTVLRFGHGGKVYAFQWCYLCRDGEGRGVIKSIDISSLSEARVKDMPLALERLSKWLVFINARPKSVKRLVGALGGLLSWADQPQHARRFEAILGDPDIALEALKGYHTYLRNRLQSHLITSQTAGQREQDAIACMSEIQGRIYKDHIEPLQALRGKGTKAPAAQLVSEFSSTLQALFDSAAAMMLGDRPVQPVRLLRVCASDDSKAVELAQSYGPLRLTELACVAYAGLVFVDSGANLSVLKAYEEPENLDEQLAQPDRINLTQKAIKFRAGGKSVEVHLSATTMTRLKTYLRLRQAFVTSLGGVDIAPLFVQGSYSGKKKGEPTAVRPLDDNFLKHLRAKVSAAGVSLPQVTLRQLRSYKQQDLVRRAPVAVAAKIMGHSVETAIKAYCSAQDATRQGEMSEFLGSLQKTVVEASESFAVRSNPAVIPIGHCADHGKPSPASSTTSVAPDCRKTEGCFFCGNYRLHADAEDVKKLMSCRRVLKYLVPMHGDTVQADRIYTAVMDRIDALLGELRRRQPQAFEAARVEVEERGNLTRYWAGKLQQLHLLGMLPSAATV